MTYKIGIIGAGAIGCFIGGQLVHAGADVYFLGRERLWQKILNEGLTITLLDGSTFNLPKEKIQWVVNEKNLPTLDLVIITTKSHDTKSSALKILNKIHDKSIILSLQNGVQKKNELKNIFSHCQIITGIVSYNVVQFDNKAHFKQASNGIIFLDQSLDDLPGIDFKIVENIESHQWGKLLKNLNNALNALSNTPLVIQLTNRKERILLSLVIREAFLVLKKCGIKPQHTLSVPLVLFPYILLLPNSIYQFVAKKEFKISPEARLSMWQDLEFGRKTEIEFLNGEIATLAHKIGAQVPMNEKIVDLIKMAESGNLLRARNEYQNLLMKL
jgi:2-dehydropantoate 2-reductase